MNVSVQVGRAGRFGTKGLAITFVSGQKDMEILDDIQKRFEIKIEELPTTIDVSTYSKIKSYWAWCINYLFSEQLKT